MPDLFRHPTSRKRRAVLVCGALDPGTSPVTGTLESKVPKVPEKRHQRRFVLPKRPIGSP